MGNIDYTVIVLLKDKYQMICYHISIKDNKGGNGLKCLLGYLNRGFEQWLWEIKNGY